MATTAATARIESVAAPGGAWREATRPRGASWSLAVVALAAAVATIARGGFTPSSQLLYAGLAVLALAVAIVADERPTLDALRSPACLVLLGLALLSLLSCAWTVGDQAAAVRAALVLGALGATVAVTATACAETRGLTALVAFIALLAGTEAVAGLAAAGLRLEPMAERIGGSWRPGGTFEYPPALALLQLAALPALLRGMATRSRAVAVASAAGAALAGAVIVLAASRAELAMGAVLVVAWMAWPAARAGAGCRLALMAAAIPVAAGVGARLIAGGYAYPGETGSDGGRLVGLAVLVAGAALAWSLFRPLSVFGRHGDRNPSANAAGEERGRRRVPSLLIAALSVVLAAGLALAAGTSGKWTEPSSGADHGRVAEWKAAAETALDRPLAGAGAGGYATASAEHQSQPAGLYAHDLPLETWAELGPLGLALVVALYASAGALCWRIRNRPGAWLVVPGALAFLVANLVDWPWHLAGSAAVWALCVGACLALERRVPAA